jgi:hypothetical protein
MLTLPSPTGYRNHEVMQAMNTGNLVGGRTGGYPHYSNDDEMEVTCRVTFPDGNDTLCNGIFKFHGVPVDGVQLDHEALFVMEYGFPEGEITLFGFVGMISKVKAWLNTADGPLDVLRASFSSLKVEEGDVIPVAGPELRYMP